MKKCLPAIVLFLLAPTVGELLSGSSPPAEFFRPFPFLLLAVLYGGGAIIVREMTLRWGGGWRRFMLLAIAYGILEEGLMAKSFFDPAWMDLGLLATYGRALGVNWVWAVNLTIYHMTVSMFVPVVLAEAMFPNQAKESWIGGWRLTLLQVVFFADVVFGFFFLTSFRPPTGATIASLAVVGLLVGATRLLRFAPRTPSASTVPRAGRFLVVGFIGMTGFFFSCMWALPDAGAPPLVTVVVAVMIVMCTWALVARMSGQGHLWEDVHRVAFAAGLLLPFILIAPTQETDAARVDDTSGMTVVAVVFAVCLLVLWIRARRRCAIAADLP